MTLTDTHLNLFHGKSELPRHSVQELKSHIWNEWTDCRKVWLYCVRQARGCSDTGLQLGPKIPKSSLLLITDPFSSTFRSAWGGNQWRKLALISFNWSTILHRPTKRYSHSRNLSTQTPDKTAEYKKKDSDVSFRKDVAWFQSIPHHSQGLGGQSWGGDTLWTDSQMGPLPLKSSPPPQHQDRLCQAAWCKFLYSSEDRDNTIKTHIYMHNQNTGDMR